MPRKTLILISLLLAAFVINLDTTMVNVALPALERQLGATTTQLQWVVDAYNLVFAALLLSAGNLSDRLGRKRLLIAGLLVFGAASVAGSFSTGTGELIAARAVMGLGAALTFPATLSLITGTFVERRERARAIGLWGAIAGAAIALGPIAGGWLLDRFSWSSIFVAMGPVALAAVVLAVRYVPGTRGDSAGAARRRGPGLLGRGHRGAGLHHHRGAVLRMAIGPHPRRVRGRRGPARGVRTAGAPVPYSDD